MLIVSDDLPFPADFLFAQRCLEGDEHAIVEFRASYGPAVFAYLRNRGGNETDAADVTEWLWADCLTERPKHRPRLATYGGKAPLKNWLFTLALNRLLAIMRSKAARKKYEEEGLDIERLEETSPEGHSSTPVEAPLIALMRDAVEAGFQACPAEDFVLLQLAHLDRLREVELAKMFACSTSKINRDVKRAGERVAEATLRYVSEVDPWLELQWDDFLELCRVASPACFGMDET